MDPYFTFKYKGENFKTKVMKDAGKEPKWTDAIFKLKVSSKDDLAETITFMAFDDILFKKDDLALGSTAP